VISSLMTASRNGHVGVSATNGFIREKAEDLLISGGIIAPSPARPKPASTLRRVYPIH
jgi:hypothetical protein